MMQAKQGSPLSLQQRHLWFVQGHEQNARSVWAVQLEGQWEQPRFIEACQQVLRRHEILRTVLYRVPGMDLPMQVIAEEPLWSYQEWQLDPHSPAGLSQVIAERVTALRTERQDLQQGPLVLVRWLSVEGQPIVFLSLPALCADTTSARLMLAEVLDTYCQLPPTEEVLQYADVSAWQEDYLLTPELQEQRASWSRVIHSLSPTITLPFQQSRSATSPGACEPHSVELALSASLVQQMRRQAQQHASPFSAWLLTCWKVLLWRLNDETPVTVGVACDGRLHEELATALGPYTRFVPVEALCAPNRSFALMLASVKAAMEEATHRSLAFPAEELRAAWHQEAEAPLFAALFEYESWPATLERDAWRMVPLKRWSCAEPFLLKLSAWQCGEQLHLEISYDARQVTPAQGQALATLLQTMLEHVSTQPQELIGAIPLLGTQDEAAVRARFRGSRRNWGEQGFSQLVEAQARLRPGDLAIRSRQEQMTYQQLNARANQLAQVLQRRGVGPNVLVGILLERQAVMLVGVLAILKAGGAYLPLDGASPAERLRYQLQESQTALTLTQASLSAQVAGWEGPTLCWEELAQELAQASPHDLPASSSGEDLAYVIYTSGSTGTPKGVMVAQRNVVNYTQALCEQLGAEPGWQYATVSTLAADLGNTAIFCALASGGCVQVLDYETVTSGEAMAHWAQQHPIDVLKIVPSHLSALLEGEQGQSVLLPRRALILGGEAVPKHLLERLDALGADCVIYNHYGPTETTVGVLMRELTYETVAGQQRRSRALGGPLANCQVAIMDQRMQWVPPGIKGELYLGGTGIAWGYVEQAALTAERFVPDPFSAQAGARLYRTGDLVRYDQAGQLEFLGRADQQIKIRGYRVELGEIEAVLRQHPQVRESVVITRSDGRAEPRLVGYLLSHQQLPLAWGQLEAYLRERLPEYMVPREYVQVEHWPLSANGKVDRQRLPAPRPREEQARVLVTSSPVEDIVAQIWWEVLGTEIGRNEEFFAVGGHSLLATRIMARIRTVLPVELPVRTIFEAPTIESSARLVEAALRQKDALVLPPLQVGPRPAELPLSSGQQRLWFLAQLEPESTAYLASRALQLDGTLLVRVLEHSWQELLDRHESLRTRFDEVEGQPVQVIAPTTRLWLPVIDLQGLEPTSRATEATRLTRQEGQRLCDLQAGPLLRTALLRFGPHTHTLLLTLHHIIIDGWSMDILVREFAVLYQAGVQGRPALLAPAAVQYADYALWQRTWVQNEQLEAQLAYWRTQLASLPALEVPTDAPRHREQPYRGEALSMQLSEAVSQGVRALSRQEHVTLFMLLLAAFQVLLLRWSGQQDISVSTPIANRTRAELEGVVGFFVNTLVLRSDLSGNPSFVQLLRQVRERCLEAYGHQDVPFEKVVEALHPQRDGRRTSLFQVSFQVAYESEIEQLLPGLQLHSVGNDGASADYEIRVMVTESQRGLSCTVFYDATLFTAPTMQRLLEHYQRLLHGIVLAPEQAVGTLPLLSEQEQQLQLESWNATQHAYPSEQCVHQMFEQQVQQTPEAVALVFGEHALSYAALNQRANQLAHALQQRGVGPEVLVGICMERSLEMVIGLLAILKAGGAYLPLDPSLPQARLEYMLSDAQVGLVVIQAHQQQRLASALDGVTIIPLEAARLAQDAALLTNPINHLQADQIVYMIYTSGSTGRPKGVMNTHAGLVNRLTWMQRQYPLCEDDRVLQKTPFSFDVSVWEFFWPLITGTRLVMAQPGGHQDPTYLKELIQQEQITTLHFVPSMLQAFLLEPANIQACTSLRQVMCSGEALSASLQAHIFELAAPRLSLHNLYGPTEASIDVTYWDCFPEEQQPDVPIGRPIANTQIYLLDRELQPAPIGVASELYIGGVGLARGYFKRPDLTAERFLPNPFSKNGGERLYWTGDIARYRPDGAIEFLGRIDEQVKLRGQRIEPGEIEAALREHPVVQAAIVVLREDRPGDARLAAYIVPERQHAAEATGQAEQAFLLSQRLNSWQALYDATYQQPPSPDMPHANFVGWNSSYTDQPIALEEMLAWQEDTLALVRSYQPERIWEIGCGTGLLLLPLAPACTHYYGTDFSAVALQGLEQQLKNVQGLSPTVTLLQQTADDFSAFPEEPIDTILINSVIQYFPSIEYLLHVLNEAVRRVASGGRIIVGDVRSLPLLEAFAALVELSRAPETLTRQQLWQQVQQHLSLEKELVLDPAFFWHWAHTTGRVRRVEVRLKRGRAHNELTQFRYQVVLHVGDARGERSAQRQMAWGEELDWSAGGLTWQQVCQQLRQLRPPYLRVRHVPNARVDQAVRTVRWLKAETGPETVGDWHKALQQRIERGVEPEVVWEEAEQLGYKATISWRDLQADGSYSVWFQRSGDGSLDTDPEEMMQDSPWAPTPHPSWQHYANQPLWGEQKRLLVPLLRQYLQERLPAAMVPASLLVLDALPVTAHGKLDRRGLPDPERELRQVDAGQEMPGTPIEHLIGGIWSELLGHPQLGVRENFFALGGHSLLVTQMVARIRTLLQVEMPVRTVFDEPTIAGLARWIEQALRINEAREQPLRRAEAYPEEIPLSFAQQRLWFLDQLHPDSTQYLSTGLLRLRGKLSSRAVEQSIQQIVARHEILRTTFTVRDEHPAQVIHPVSPFVLPIIDLSYLQPEQRQEQTRALAAQDGQRPYHLAIGPLFRLYLLLLAPQEQMLVLSMHHIITDGWSNELFLRELSVLYRSYAAHEPSPLTPLPVQYADYALWQRQRLQGERLHQHLAYWQKQLQGASSLDLPTDAPRMALQSQIGARYTFVLEADLAAKLVSFGHREGVTLFMTLLTAFQVLLYRISGQTDIVVGTDVANRTHAETEGLIGFFVNLLALRSKIQGTADFLSIVQQVRTIVLGAYAHQELPFELIVEHIQVERKEQQTPLVQVLCVMQNVPRSTPDLPGSELEMLEGENTAARFDLALFLQEQKEASGIRGSVVYRAELFQEQTIATWMQQFDVLLRNIVTKPDTIIDMLEIRTDEEKAEQAKEALMKSQTKGKRIRATKGQGFEIQERTN